MNSHPSRTRRPAIATSEDDMAEEDGRSPSSKSALPIAAMAEEARRRPGVEIKARLRYNSKIYCNISTLRSVASSTRRTQPLSFGFALSPTH